MKNCIFLLVCVITFASCNDSYSGGAFAPVKEAQYSADLSYSESDSGTEMSTDNQTPASEKKIIKDGRMGIKVSDIQEAKKSINSLVSKYRGHYARDNYSDSDYSSTYTLSIKIPADNYDVFIAEIESGNGTVLYKDISVRDVTMQVIDLETRLKNKREYMERYRELLKKANTIKDILEIEQQIRAIEEEVESVEARLKSLNTDISYSTLDLNLNKTKPYTYIADKSDNFWEKIKESLFTGWDIFKYIVLLVIKLWPVWIVAFVASFIVSKVRSRNKKGIS